MNKHYLNCGLVELKLASSGESDVMEFSGYGAVFNNVDAYGDVIEPGAFANYLSKAKNDEAQWPAMLLQHGGWGVSSEDLMPVGSWIDLAEDGTGLKVTGKLADTHRGRDSYKLMKLDPRPAITGLSIGYIPKEWEPRSKAEEPRRRLKRVDLVEISLVTFPANDKARVSGVKSLNDLTEREFERLMQDAGFSRKEARDLLNNGFRSIQAMPGAGGDELNELSALITRNSDILLNKED